MQRGCTCQGSLQAAVLCRHSWHSLAQPPAATQLTRRAAQLNLADVTVCRPQTCALNAGSHSPPAASSSHMAGMDRPSSSGSGGSEDMMMMMQMWFYAGTKVTLWFHSWSISSAGACALPCALA